MLMQAYIDNHLDLDESLICIYIMPITIEHAVKKYLTILTITVECINNFTTKRHSISSGIYHNYRLKLCTSQ